MHVCVITHIRLLVNPRPQTVACQALLSMEFPRQEYWRGLQCPPPGDLSDPGMEAESLMSPILANVFFTAIATWEAYY